MFMIVAEEERERRIIKKEEGPDIWERGEGKVGKWLEKEKKF